MNNKALTNASIQSARFQVALDKFVEANPLPRPTRDRYAPRRQDFMAVADTLRKTIDRNLPGDWQAQEISDMDEFGEYLLAEHKTPAGLTADGLYVVDATMWPQVLDDKQAKYFAYEDGEYDLEFRMTQLLAAMPAATDGRVLAVYFAEVIG